MAERAPDAVLEQAVSAYLAGDGATAAGARYGVSQSRLRRVLQERNQWRDKAADYALRAQKLSRDIRSLPDEEIAARFLAGESVNALAEAYSVARNVIDRRLRSQGVDPRGQDEANRLSMSRRSPEENARNTAAAHDAVRGVKRTEKELILRAQVREASVEWQADHVSAYELQFARWMRTRGIPLTPQKAIGPYNVDFTCGRVAIEIHGGAWHGYGEHRERAPERFRYILTAGWNIAIVWAGARRVPLTAASADVVGEFIWATQQDALHGRHLVVWGDGEVVPSEGFGLEDLAAIPTRLAAGL